jgi:DNA topoisomerase-1
MLAPHLFPPRPDGTDPRKCPNCESGKLSLKLGRFGGFIGCTNYPECRYTRQLAAGNGDGMRKLGLDPETGLEVTVRSGRFGPYIQLGEPTQDAEGKAEKPKRAGLPKGVSPDDIELDRALGLLSLPREVGKHPDDGEPILAGVGRFGPYVQHGKTYANLTADEDVLTVGLNRAVALIEEKKTKGPRKSRFGADPGRSLGDHPDKGGPVVVKSGRYGPYVSHAGVNATLPADLAPEAVTLEQAIPLLDARAARGGGKKAAGRKAPSGKKAAAKPEVVTNGAGTSVPPRPRSTARKAPKAKSAAKPALAPAVEGKLVRKAKAGKAS